MADGGKVGSAYVEVSPKLAGNFKSAIEKAMPSGSDGGSRFGGGFSKGMTGAVSAGAVAVGNILADVAMAGASAARDIIGGALTGFSDFEQLSGGVDKLFGKEAAATVKANAAKAFESAGMSANQYMEQATSFSASLISSLGGDTAQAANLADEAMRAMSDNVNVFGSNMGDVQNAFQGFAKQNYTMLDNLKLGYGGTKSEMERLVSEAANMTEAQEELGLTVDGTSLSFDNIIKAIQVVQKEQGIYGTTANEAAKTVEGSVNMMKASWENWLAALGRGDADMSALTDQLVTSVETAAQNVFPVLGRIGEQLASGIPELGARLAPLVTQQVDNVVLPAMAYLSAHGPEVAAAAGQMFAGLAQGAAIALPGALGMLGSVVASLISMVPAALPGMISGAVSLFTGLLVGLVQYTPTVASALASFVFQLPSILMSAAGQMVGAALVFFLSIGQAFGQFVNDLGPKFEYFITHLPEIVVNAVTGMADAAGQLWDSFINGIIGACQNGVPMVEGAGEQTAQAATAAAEGAADATSAGSLVTSTMSQGMDYDAVTAAAESGMQDVTAAAAKAAEGVKVSENLTQTAATSLDVTAMNANATKMSENAVQAAKSVDFSAIGKALSEGAAGGVDVNAMNEKAAELAKASAANMNQTSTVSVKADLSGVNALKGAASTVSAAFASMRSASASAMSAVASALSSAGSSAVSAGSRISAGLRGAQSAAASLASALRSSMSSAASAASSAATSIKSSIARIPSSKTITLSISKPHIPVPHWSMSGSFNPKTGSVPSVSAWWGAEGGILTKATIFGAGEAGPEAVLPLSKLPGLLGLDDRGPTQEITINLAYDASADAEQMARDVARNVRLYRMAGAM